MMKRVLVVCPTMYEWAEINKKGRSRTIEIFTKEFNEQGLTRLLYGCKASDVRYIQSPKEFIDDTIAFCKQHAIDAVLSASDYPGCVFASIIADELGFPGPKPEILLSCQNKYQSRCAQAQYLPEVTPRFTKFDPQTMDTKELISLLPLYIKPIKSRISILACYIAHEDQLKEVNEMNIAPEYAEYFNWFLKQYSTFEPDGHCFIVEQALTGVQTTVEGYVFEGDVVIIGVIDSIMYPGTQSFEQFVYPSQLPSNVCERMTGISKKFITAIGYDNGFFNIEFMYNQQTGALYIIEVNSRICSQFFDLYEKVDGFNSYDTLINVATGVRPNVCHLEGPYACAGILVLRTFSDAYVEKIPTKREREAFYHAFPHGKFHSFVSSGQKLSDNPQDAASYRYGLIHLGAENYKELETKFSQAKSMLPFSFEVIG